MNIRKALTWILQRKEYVSVAGLGILFLTAGGSKFFLTNLWIGFEPAFILELLNISSTRFALISGAGESLLGLWLLSMRKIEYASILASLWLFGITVQMIRLEAWTLAIRDMGLFFYSISVLLSRIDNF